MIFAFLNCSYLLAGYDAWSVAIHQKHAAKCCLFRSLAIRVKKHRVNGSLEHCH